MEVIENKRPGIMLVDDNITDLTMGKDLLSSSYEVFSLSSAEEMFEVLEKVPPDLILLESRIAGMGAYQAMTKLKASTRYVGIPVIFLISGNDEESEHTGSNLGVVDFISKPFSGSRLLKRVEIQLTLASQRNKLRDQQDQIKNFDNHLQVTLRKTTDQIYNLQNAMLSTVAELVEFRDNITGGHIFRTQRYLSLLMTRLISRGIYMETISSWDLNFLLPSAQLHDVGKIAISDLILNKPGKLDPEEYNTMKRHTLFGVEAIERIEKKTSKHEFLQYAKIFAGTHHEKWDGTGYPHGLQGQDIPLQGRLMAIADVYDALIAARPYKNALPVQDAEQIIYGGAGTHFDPCLVEVFGMVAEDFAKIAELSRESP